MRRAMAMFTVMASLVVPGHPSYGLIAADFVIPVGDLDGDGRQDVVVDGHHSEPSWDVRLGRDGSLLWSVPADGSLKHLTSIPGVPAHDALIVTEHPTGAERDQPLPPPFHAAARAGERRDLVRLFDGRSGDLVWERSFFASAYATTQWGNQHPWYPAPGLWCRFPVPCLPGRGGADTDGQGIANATGITVAREMGDANGDGAADIFITWRPEQDLSIGLALDRSTGEEIGSFAVQDADRCAPNVIWPTPDLDGDGSADLVTFTSPFADRIQRRLDGLDRCEVTAFGWDATEIWRGPAFYLPPSPDAWLEFPDLNGDGSPDVAFGIDGLRSYAISDRRAAFDGRTGERLWVGFPGHSHLFVEDRDGDGGDDLLLVSWRDYAGPSTMEVLSGATGGVIASVSRETETVLRTPRIRTDLDGDGCSDVIVSEEGWTGTWEALSCVNGSTLWFAPPFVSALGADLDGNGNEDVAMRRSEGPSTWYDLRDGSTLALIGTVPAGGEILALDLSEAPGIEVLSGRSAYRADGTWLWTAP